MNKLERKIGGESAPYVDFVEAYRLEELGFQPENCSACYYTTAETANETPKLEYVSDLMRGNCVSELILTAAPTLLEAVDFLRKEYNIYIVAYPLVAIDEEGGNRGYKETGHYMYRYNEFQNGRLVTMECMDPERDGYDETLDAAIKDVVERLYKASQPMVDPIFGDVVDGSDTPF